MSKNNLSIDSVSFMQQRRCRLFRWILLYIESDGLTKLLIALIGPICKKLLRAGAIADLNPETMMEEDATANMATIMLRHNGSIFAIVSAFGSGFKT